MADSTNAGWFMRAVAIVVMLSGLALLAGGVWLMFLGGSLYYGLAGLVLVASAFLLWRGHRAGKLLYALFFVATMVWALAEAGLDGWALAPRIIAPAVLGLIVWLACTPRLNTRTALRTAALPAAAVVGLIAFSAMPSSLSISPAAAKTAARPAATDADPDWRFYGGNPGGTRFSPLAQINASNVGALEQAWIFHDGNPSPLQAHESTPLKIGDRLYGCTPHNIIYALDPATGREIWRYNPKPNPDQVQNKTCRTVAYAETNATADGSCTRRIIFGTIDARLMAVDADTSRLCAGFGQDGAVDLLEGMGEVQKGHYFITSGPVIARGIAVVGGWVKDNVATDMPSGVIRGFDVQTGKLRWAWDMGRPDLATLPPARQSYTRGTPNAWGLFSADDALGLVYVPTGNPAPDFFGGQRRHFDERYGSSIVALDATTGRPRWSFQTVHHDLWDYDIGSQPVLFTMPGSNTPAVAVATKRGEIFILDRRTGRPIIPVAERRVPTDGVPGERVSPTQPFPVGFPNVTGASVTEREMWGVTPIDQMICRIKFRQSRWQGFFTPPGLDPTILLPGTAGGLNWGGVSVDEARGIMIVNSTRMPFRLQLVPRTERPAQKATGAKSEFDYFWNDMAGTPYVANVEPLMGPLAVPCLQPPWGLITAIDLRSRKILWQKPLGTSRENGPLGIASGLPIPVGTPNAGGSIVTQGGLIFIAAATDNFLRAFDIRTGEELWRHALPAGGQATPMTYMAGGRQYVVIDAGGHQGLATRANDTLVAYALPRSTRP
jgi:quinoprotein glucose dehydrogenase